MELTIKLKVKDVEVELTMQEARELAETLQVITGQVITGQPIMVPYNPWYVPWCPPLQEYWKPIWAPNTMPFPGNYTLLPVS